MGAHDATVRDILAFVLWDHFFGHECNRLSGGGDSAAVAAWPRRGHKNQQSTKSTETTMMTATTITIETKGTAVAAKARLQRGGSGQHGGGGVSVGGSFFPSFPTIA